MPQSHFNTRHGRALARRGFTLVEIMIVVGVISVIISIALPGIMSARLRSRAKACLENQVKLNWAVSEWALATNSGDTPAWNELVGPGLFLNRTPRCPTTLQVVAIPSTLDADTACPTDEPKHSANSSTP